MKKTALITVSIVSILLIGGLFVLKSQQAGQGPVEPTPTVEQIETLPEDALTASFTSLGGRNYRFTLEKIPDGVVALSYEISYETTNRGMQGVISSPVEIKSGQTTYQNDKFLFGTCSKNKCVYDEGFKTVDVAIRLAFSDGKEKIWKKTLPAPK